MSPLFAGDSPVEPYVDLVVSLRAVVPGWVETQLPGGVVRFDDPVPSVGRYVCVDPAPRTVVTVPEESGPSGTVVVVRAGHGTSAHITLKPADVLGVPEFEEAVHAAVRSVAALLLPLPASLANGR